MEPPWDMLKIGEWTDIQKFYFLLIPCIDSTKKCLCGDKNSHYNT